TAISDAIPSQSTTFANAELAVIHRILDLLPPGKQEERANWLDRHGVTLYQTGRIEQALAVMEEAAAIRRGLAAADPDGDDWELADSLSSLGIVLAVLGRLADALPVTEEAIANYRKVAAARPHIQYLTPPDSPRPLAVHFWGLLFSYRPSLADSLS